MAAAAFFMLSRSSALRKPVAALSFPQRTLLAKAVLFSQQKRQLSSSTRKLTLEQAMTSSHLILSELQSPAVLQQLQSASHTDLLSKWQLANTVLIQATLRALPQVGFPANAVGLHGYTEAFAEQARSDQPETRLALQQLNESKWRVLLKHAFDCEPAQPISLQAARELAIDMVDAMQDPDLIKQVAGPRTGLASRLSDAEHQQLVARTVVDVQAEVMGKHGFSGDSGYAQAQVCLMEHAHDAVVTASVAAATTNLYARAGINLNAAFKQMGGA